jgi:8-amino-7-oxononanoate synthase
VIVPDGTSQIIPVIVGDNERAVSIAQALQADGFDVRAIRPPSVPPGTARLRISVNAGLSERTLDTLAGLVSAALCSAACS